MKVPSNRSIGFLFCACLFFISGGCAWVPSSSERSEVETMPSVDLNHYTGTWYEIARLPMWFQQDCVASQAVYTLLLTGQLKVKNQCMTNSGDQKHIEGLATVVNPTTNAKLYVVFDNWATKLFSGWGSTSTRGNYWILSVDQDYQTALVGTPDREYLWILSRTPSLDQLTYKKLVDLGTQQGYPTTELIRDFHP